MLNPDDDQFEQYLKRFSPLIPEPLPMRAEQGRQAHSVPVFAMWAGIAAIVLVAVTLSIQPAPKTDGSIQVVIDQATGNPARAEQALATQRLTVGRANALLSRASSFEAAFDAMAWRSRTPQMSADKQSALAALSKENFKL